MLTIILLMQSLFMYAIKSTFNKLQLVYQMYHTLFGVRVMMFNATFNQQYFSYIVVVSFIGGGNRST
jgi:hypothetical protein